MITQVLHCPSCQRPDMCSELILSAARLDYIADSDWDYGSGALLILVVNSSCEFLGNIPPREQNFYKGTQHWEVVLQGGCEVTAPSHSLSRSGGTRSGGSRLFPCGTSVPPALRCSRADLPRSRFCPPLPHAGATRCGPWPLSPGGRVWQLCG